MKTKKRNGYTLVEMIIYVGIVALVIIAIVGVILGITKSSRYVGALNEIENSAILSLSRISREVRLASSMSTSTNCINFATSTVYSSVCLNSGVININGDPLTSSKINISKLLFTQITSTSSKAIRIEMTMTATSSGKLISKDFNTTTVLRGVQ